MNTTKYASEGAVRQDGLLPVAECKNCHSQIVWATSKRTGKKYPVNTFRGQGGRLFYIKRAAHTHEECARRAEAFHAYKEQLVAEEFARNQIPNP